ncbi:MAG: GntR family transcriptional regulator [Planctomycetota bacterium]
MFHIQIDPHTGVPVYRQVMDQIRYYAAANVLPPGARLPSIRELAKRLSVNPTTVVKAYTELQHEGLIEMRHGSGAFISGDAPRMSEAEKKRILRRLARQLAVEARQMDASKETVMKLLADELERLES